MVGSNPRATETAVKETRAGHDHFRDVRGNPVQRLLRRVLPTFAMC
jgi:hypothetical protein